jgi:hypothetical protein
MPAKKPETKPATKLTATSATEQLIREIAHKLWVEEGHPEGKAEDHWFKAIEIATAKKTVAAKKLIAAKKATANTDTKPAAKPAKKQA